MQVKILGCSGGIGHSLRTTSFLVDEDILIDAGTGVGDLSIEALCKIDHIFLTHSHLDHIASIPFLLDTVMGMRAKPVTVHATTETLEVLKEHIFNWKVWPDFNVIPDARNPFLRYQVVHVGETVEVSGRWIPPLPANHTVPAVGYRLDSGKSSLVFTGDTTSCDELWDHVNKIDNLKYVVIETAFGDEEIVLARLSKHLCPALLKEELKKLQRPAEIYITHLKPGEDAIIMQEVGHMDFKVKPAAIYPNQVFEL